VAALQAQAAETRQALERAEYLLGRGSGARAPVEDARRRLQGEEARIDAASRRLEDTIIRAPFDGRIGLRDLSVGALVEPGTEIATLDAVSPMAVRFTVPEQQLGEIRLDAEVEARTAAFEADRFTGRVRALGSRVDPALRTIEVEAQIANEGGRLRPGMLMTVTVATRTVPDAVVVPPLAVQVRGEQHFVYRVVEGKAQRAPVRIGGREPERVQIEEGLKAGDEIVVGGVQNVTEGQPVRVVPPGGDPQAVAARQGGDKGSARP
jgi:membrane fusion protein (multidrug efflux system)